MSNHFDQKAKKLDEHPIMREVALKFAQVLTTNVHISQNVRMLDYGCGPGLIGMHLYKKSGSIVMMDTSEGMLNIVQGKIEKNEISNMEIMKCELEDTPIEPDPFDVIYLNNVLHHIEDISTFFEAARKLLKPTGYLCIGDLEKEDGSFHEDNTSVKHFGFKADEMDNYLTGCGFKKITHERYYTVRKPDSSGKIREYPLFFTIAGKV